jgi:ATP-dependent DNA helicase RecQ
MAELRQGAYKILYAAPERLQFEGFRNLLQALRCPLIAIDEAHCISEWGHDFRPEYLKIGELLQSLPDARVLACTATATPVVRDEILNRLGLPAETPQIVQGFARPNLALRVIDTSRAKARQAVTDALLQEALEAPGKGRGTAIVYGPTRKSCEEEAVRLQARGWRADAYHAGMDGSQRERVQMAFLDGDLEIAVATNAFGMGIDRSDVRAVVHLAPPGSIESYYQEVGRAGRDGAPAFGLMCTSAADLPLRRSLLERGGPTGEAPPAAVVDHKWGLFLELMRWAEGGSCRHDAILRYFSDEAETLSGCGRCDVCLMLEGVGEDHDPEQVQLVVRKALSAVARIHGRFGLSAAVQMLLGTPDPRLTRAGFDQVRTFGVLKTYSEAWVLALLRRCVTAGWVDFVGGDRPMAILTQSGMAVMKAQAPARILLPPASTGQKMAATGQTRRKQAIAAVHTDLDAAATKVFEALRLRRMQLSKAAQVPPYVVASDRTLRDLAVLRPRNLEEMQQAHGIGVAKASRFGPDLLQVIANPH